MDPLDPTPRPRPRGLSGTPLPACAEWTYFMPRRLDLLPSPVLSFRPQSHKAFGASQLAQTKWTPWTPHPAHVPGVFREPPFPPAPNGRTSCRGGSDRERIGSGHPGGTAEEGSGSWGIPIQTSSAALTRNPGPFLLSPGPLVGSYRNLTGLLHTDQKLTLAWLKKRRKELQVNRKHRKLKP